MGRKFPEKIPRSVLEEAVKDLEIGGKKAEVASQNEVGGKGLLLYAEHVLEVLGHPEAVVSDESIVWDFF